VLLCRRNLFAVVCGGYAAARQPPRTAGLAVGSGLAIDIDGIAGYVADCGAAENRRAHAVRKPPPTSPVPLTAREGRRPTRPFRTAPYTRREQFKVQAPQPHCQWRPRWPWVGGVGKDGRLTLFRAAAQGAVFPIAAILAQQLRGSRTTPSAMVEINDPYLVGGGFRLCARRILSGRFF